MKQHIAEMLAEHVNDAEVRYNYSGRGMYTATTTGLTFGTLPDLTGGMASACRDIDDLFARQQATVHDFEFRFDQMGKGYIIY